jgi:hypothetical protein
MMDWRLGLQTMMIVRASRARAAVALWHSRPSSQHTREMLRLLVVQATRVLERVQWSGLRGALRMVLEL